MSKRLSSVKKHSIFAKGTHINSALNDFIKKMGFYNIAKLRAIKKNNE